MARPVSGNAKEVITIRIDRELLEYLDGLDGDRSGNIRKAIACFKAKQEQTNYSKLLRSLKQP